MVKKSGCSRCLTRPEGSRYFSAFGVAKYRPHEAPEPLRCYCAFRRGKVYSKAELVAEIGSSALVNHCGLETQKSFRNNTAYIQSWLSVLKNDKRFIVSASSKAEKAVRFILEGQ